MDNPAEALLAEVERYLEETGTPPTTFGIKALGDPTLVWGLRKGREPKFRTVQRIKDFIASQSEEAR